MCAIYANSQVVIATTKVRIFKQITTYEQLNVIVDRLLLLPQRYVFSSKSQQIFRRRISVLVVIATTKVRIFKQITTGLKTKRNLLKLLLLPQRYVFSSKSQPNSLKPLSNSCCYCYHKGTYFQANHNHLLLVLLLVSVVIATTKVRIFKQITTVRYNEYKTARLLLLPQRYVFSSKSQQNLFPVKIRFSCYCYHKGTYFQANHNRSFDTEVGTGVVIATTKVRIFKQITTTSLISQPICCCCCYHKGTYFQANHNRQLENEVHHHVVVATTKVRIFKQITTIVINYVHSFQLLLLPQRYVFSSKSQPMQERRCKKSCCCCYHKGTYFQANHNIIK